MIDSKEKLLEEMRNLERTLESELKASSDSPDVTRPLLLIARAINLGNLAKLEGTNNQGAPRRDSTRSEAPPLSGGFTTDPSH